MPCWPKGICRSVGSVAESDLSSWFRGVTNAWDFATWWWSALAQTVARYATNAKTGITDPFLLMRHSCFLRTGGSVASTSGAELEDSEFVSGSKNKPLTRYDCRLARDDWCSLAKFQTFHSTLTLHTLTSCCVASTSKSSNHPALWSSDVIGTAAIWVVYSWSW